MNRETSIHSSDTLVVVDRSRQRRRWIIIAVAAVLLLALGVALMMRGGESKTADTAAGSAQVPNVSVVVPGRTQVGKTITASGPLGARRDQPVGIAGSGGRVVRVFVDAGSWVRAGQVLAVVDRSVQAQQAAQLAAQVDAARANAALAQSNYERALALKGRGFVSKAEIDSKKATRDSAYAQVRVAQAQLAATRAEIGRLNVTAPTSGLILSRSVEAGQVVGAGSPALFRLAEGGEMEMRAQLSQQDLAGVHVGMPATVTPVGSTTNVTGSVWQVAPVIDPQSRLGEVRIAVPYSPAMRPGGFAEARISSGTTTAPLLPQSAVLSDDNGNYVYIINSKNVVERRNIQIGSVDDAGVTIAAGLSGNEAVVLSAGPFLNPGQKVKPQRQAAR
ncbi:efflux RND transporter periplasmic adaptor subunit [Sphingomonas hankyongi]|uniref:Efflux RND transporter periplasmic adaptor subunit n=1 Tax=Sphingomonas hankyongi TaxID=2908209 RepID=A0ABT0RZI9_9SPHN|nr:efflux RND transporter periplasmic adaptor subunit [Sphingomonas hankyongi]MCL6729014.1 efflux RND transporter periplasmic adaptor subunit [Sphingomonas hankyongi]